MIFETLTQPTLILDEARCKANIHRMCHKANEQGVVLRPHFKTHQSKIIGRWFRDMGIDKITVSSVGMARYFAEDGWKDITIAFPVNVRQINEINALSAQVKLGLLVLDADTVDILGMNLNQAISIWIKIDVGTHRTGIDPTQTESIDDMLERLAKYPQLSFAGFLAHAGHTYHSRSVTEVQRIYDHALAELLDLKTKYVGAFPAVRISLGDTPGASMVRQFGSVDELRPGNFVFYDLMQEEIGACQMEDIAVAMACPVVAVHPERKQWIIYGGAIHFSKDFLLMGDGRKCFGRMVNIKDEVWSTVGSIHNPFLISLSQEHGVVQCTDQNFDLCSPGDIALWLPVHSCLTADAMGSYINTEGAPIDHYRRRMYD
ncbi:MAG TPA: alanine racemase [Saprospiraceae bacterium]|nr:alanine racemase [Saprospiraceae bacterium]